MIGVRLGELSDADSPALFVPIDTGASAVTRAGRRILSQAGPAVEERCRRLGELPVGSAVVTEAGELECEFLIHLVVRGIDEPVTAGSVRRALLNGLRRAAEWGIEAVATPLIGTGAANLDAERAAEIMVPVVHEHARTETRPERVLIVAESAYELAAIERALGAHHGAIPDSGG